MATIVDDLKDSETLDDLYRNLDACHIQAGWAKDEPSLWDAPRKNFLPMHWSWAEGRAALDAAGRLVDTELAERRNLILFNPVEGNRYATVRTMICAYQMILPGEKARSHRHAPHALRVILDGNGSYSTVDGEKTPMETGDVVLTPGWCWHGHGHDGDEPAYWFDGLDVPLNHLLEPMFFEDHPDGFEEVETVTEVSPYRFSRETIPKGLEDATEDPDGHYAPRIKLAAPTMPTIGLHVNRLDGGAKTRRQRSTSNTIFVVMAGAGTSTIAGREIDWAYGDTFVAPCWTWIEHAAATDSVVFSMSDEPLMRFANYHRFEGA